MPPAIRAINISKTFHISEDSHNTVKHRLFNLFNPPRGKKIPAVKTMDFEVHRGECVGLLGRNGCGKSTLVKLLAAKLRRAWPQVRLIVRADSGFCRPKALRRFDQWGIHYVIGLAKNEALLKTVAVAQLALADRRAVSKCGIAGGVAVGVVDLLEMVQVDPDQTAVSGSLFQRAHRCSTAASAAM